MERKVIVAIILYVISGLLILVSLIIVFTDFGSSLLLLAEGIISFIILPQPAVIIDSPVNITYNFTIAEFVSNNMFIDLNVSSTSTLGADIWSYELVGIDVGLSSGSIGFTPNSSINVYRKSNILTVFGMNSSTGSERNASVTFFAFVPNSAPVIENLAVQNYVCEDSFLSVFFNATDIDGDSMTASMTPQFPQNPFFISLPIIFNTTLSIFEIFSGILNKADAGGIINGSQIYSTVVSVIDNYNISCCSDSLAINITVMGVNHAPEIYEFISNQAILNSGSTIYNETRVNDIESGNESSGLLSFNISFVNITGDKVTNLFNISNNGVINFTSDNTPSGDYNVTVCATDNGLLNPHVNISDFCGQDGGNLSDCRIFNLIVSKIPQPPAPPSGGGGGGGGGSNFICEPIWGCEEWTDCKKFEKLLNRRVIRNETLRSELMSRCDILNFTEENCGYQQRTCLVVNECFIDSNKPNITRGCYYLESPDCRDGVKNCHAGSCEVLVDCGGPCNTCPNCRDGIQNQDEKGIDCGGPCLVCIFEGPNKNIQVLRIVIYSVSIIFLLVVIILLVRYLVTRKKYKEVVGERIKKKIIYSK